MILSDKPKFDINLNIRGHIISQVNSAKCLGIIIDDRLCFDKHVNYLCRKASKSLGIILKLSHFVPPTVILNLYYTLLHPHFIYGITAWGSSGVIHINRINSLQKKALKLLPILNNNACNFYSYEILNIRSLYSYFSSIKFYKIFKQGQHEHFLHDIISLLPVHSYQTRHKENEHFNLPLCKKSFLFQSTKYWNSLPAFIRDS
jgi:hypothetical protein